MVLQFFLRDPLFGDAVDRGKIELPVVGSERKKELEHFVEHFVRPGVLPIDFVDHDDRLEVQFQRFLQDELRARQRSFSSIDQEQHAVDHFQRPFNLPCKIGVPRGIHNVDLYLFAGFCLVEDRRVLGEDCYAALPLQLVRVHHARPHILVRAECSRLPQHMIDQRRLSMIDVGNDCYVSCFPLLSHIRFKFLSAS